MLWILHWGYSGEKKLRRLMVRLGVAMRRRVIILWRGGYSIRDIHARLREEEIDITLRSLQHLIAKFSKYHTIQDLTRAHKIKLLTANMMGTIEESLRSNDELTARKLRTKLSETFPNAQEVSLSTIKRCRKQLGWVCTCLAN